MVMQIAGAGTISGLQAGGLPDGSVTNPDLAAGAVTPDKTQVGALPSCIIVSTGNNNGSTNTFVKRFSNVLLNQGADITYADSATLGGSFTINTTGVYAMSYSDAFTGAADLVITANGVTLTSSPSAVADITRVAIADSNANLIGNAAATRPLSAGTIIRAQNITGTQAGAGAYCQFTIVRVA